MWQDIFNEGTLMMSVCPAAENINPHIQWGELLSSKILMVLSALIVLLCLNDFIRIFPSLIRNLWIARINTDIEHNASTSRVRRLITLACVIPFCLIISRYGVYSFKLLSTLSAEWNTPAIIAIFFIYILVRKICFLIIKPSNNPETAISIHRAMYTYFILLVTSMAAVCGISALFNAPDIVVRRILSWMFTAFFLLGFIRTGQIISSNHSFLTTFLYLCSLELIPVGLLYIAWLVL